VSDWQLETPVVFIVFNRPDVTARVFEQIARARPPRLLVIADGPRPDRPGEAERCAATRAIATRVDWDCELLTNFADTNMGCGRRVSSGLDWAFEQAEELIVLEDDCVPDPAFFRFCQDLLRRYRDDKRVMMIGGTNVLSEWKADRQSYHFSYPGGVWGWASWRRAWRHYDFEMSRWRDPEIQARIADLLVDPLQIAHTREAFDRMCHRPGTLDTWDYQWNFARFVQGGLAIVPAVNLVSNLGFTPEATHTKWEIDGVSGLATGALDFPLKDPGAVVVDRAFDARTLRHMLRRPPLHRLVLRRLRRLLAERSPAR